MAFCKFCGKELGPDGKCDCPQSQQEAKAQKSPLKNKKVLIGAAAAVVVVVIAVIIGVSVSGANSYKAPINNLVKLINQQNTDPLAYQKLVLDPGTVKYLQSQLKMIESTKDELEDAKEDLEEYYDDIQGFKITKCDISDADKMSKKDLKEIKEQLPSKSEIKSQIEMIEEYDDGDYEEAADEFEISEGDARKLAKVTIDYFKSLSDLEITEGYKLTVRLYAEYDGDTGKAEKVKDVRVVKVNGTWILYDVQKLLVGSQFEDLSDVSLSELYRYIQNIGTFAGMS